MRGPPLVSTIDVNVVVLTDTTNPTEIFEAGTVYKLGGTGRYLAVIEAFDSGSNQRPAWTQDISSGELIRTGYDQHATVDPCHLRYVYQGFDPASSGLPYNSLPWKIGLLTKTK